MTNGLILKMDFLKNLKKFVCFLRITPVEKSFTKSKLKLNKEKKSCLKLVDSLKIFWKKNSVVSKIYLELEAIK
jgi:hypothetical protein